MVKKSGRAKSAKAARAKTTKARKTKAVKASRAKAAKPGDAKNGKSDGAKVVAAELVYQSCLLMDDMKFEDFLKLCTDDFQYTVTVYSPEAKIDMTWMDEDKESMERLLKVLPRHNSDHTPLSRHATVYRVDFDPKKNEAHAISSLQLFRTELDGGATELFAVGKLYDTIRMNGGGARLASRNVRLTTRMLGLGSHVPL